MAGGTLHGKQIKHETIDWTAIKFDPATVPRASDNTNALDNGYLGGSVYVSFDGQRHIICMVEPYPDVPEPTGLQFIVGALDAGPLPGTTFQYDAILDQTVREQDSLGGNVLATLPSYNVPIVYYYAEPITEPVKTSWYVDSLNNEPIGTQTNREGTWLLADGQFTLTTNVLVRIYFTSFETEFSTVEFRV